MSQEQATWQPMLTERGARLVLPQRGLPTLRGIGAALIVFGALFSGMFLLITGPLWWPDASGPGIGWAGVLFPLIGLAGLGAAVAFGLLVGFGHGELHVTDDEVIGLDRYGPVRITRRVAITDLERLVVGAGSAQVNGRPVESGPWSDLAVLQAERRSGPRRSVLLVIGYPRAQIETLAEEVRARLGREIEIEQRFATSRRDLAGPLPLAVEPVPDQPAQSAAAVVRTNEGLVIELPALGFFRGSKGLGCFSLVWLTIVAAFGAGAFVMLFTDQPGAPKLLFAGVTILFGAIGLWLFRSSLRSGRRRAIIEVTGEALTIATQSLGAPLSYSWRRSELHRVVAGPSGVEINHRPVLELHVHTATGKKVRLLRERNDAELIWIAAELNAALGLGAEDSEPSGA